MLRIYHINNSSSTGGAAQVMQTLLKYVDKSKFFTSFYAEEYPPLSKTIIISKYLRFLESFVFANDLESSKSAKLFNSIQYQDSNVVHLHNLHGNYFNLNYLKRIDKDKKIIWTLHDAWAITGKCAMPDNTQKWENGYHRCQHLLSYPPMLWDNTRYLWNFKKKVYSQLSNTTIVVPSKWLFNMVSNSILGHLPIKYIPNGIDTKIFAPGENRALKNKLGIKADQKAILLVGQGGRKNEYKGWEHVGILRKQLLSQNYHILYAGDDGKSNKLEHYLGSLSQQELSEYYKICDLLLFPSKIENCPLSVIEAMSSGLPILCFASGGLPELVKHKKNGYLAKYGESRDLLSGIIWIFSLENSSINKMKQSNRGKVINKYSLEQMISSYQKLYSQT